ncbi:transcription antiterminator [Streptococcus anginosus]|uniref:Transcription antiterminator n=2 Tax=Streptococcus TaxID=1301 RepID=A0AAU7Q0E2_9STRE|nr:MULTISPECIES: transcription antiterminator [Streptococcus]MBC5619149.1 transcription antiterminator [Streptococcus hominis]MCW0924672.1 transcription antiterminator [Streptococcus anginosus]PRT69242.1 transcription antiterminator [Streptococcus anginosus]QOG25710.1 transcription antiterminator [Streptococcus sp. KS 6]VTS43520.1 phosphotransferase [Streptococcus anginosus]
MILLDQTSCDLLKYLIQLEEPETIMTISRATNQSRRKIYYHLEKINDALADVGEVISSRPRVGIVLTAHQKELCQALLEGVDFYSYVMSMTERMQLTVLYICIAKERVTIEKLMELTEVSRNTVLNDLNEIRNQLASEQYQVNLASTKAQGYFLKCHPLNKIQYVHSLLYHIFVEENHSFVMILTEKIKEFIREDLLLSDELQDFLNQRVQDVEQDLGKKINRHEIKFMLQVLPYLLLSCRNMALNEEEQEDLKREFTLIRKRIEYQAAKHLNNNLGAIFGLKLNDIEISLLTVLLLSYRKDRDIHATSQDFVQLKEAIDEFIWRFEVSSHFEIENKEDLLRNLLTHCKALLFRKTYGILSKNPLTRQIKEKYADLFAVTKSCSVILEEAWLISLTDDEVAYLALHMGGFLKHNRAEKQDAKRIYLVCDEGVAVQKLLLKQCLYHLPNENLSAVFTTEQFKSVEDILDVDLLITTNDGLETTLPTIQVQPILDYEDVLNITSFVKDQTLSTKGVRFSQDLERLLSQYLKDSTRTQELKNKIQKLVNEELLSTSTEE